MRRSALLFVCVLAGCGPASEQMFLHTIVWPECRFYLLVLFPPQPLKLFRASGVLKCFVGGRWGVKISSALRALTVHLHPRISLVVLKTFCCAIHPRPRLWRMTIIECLNMCVYRAVLVCTAHWPETREREIQGGRAHACLCRAEVPTAIYSPAYS